MTCREFTFGERIVHVFGKIVYSFQETPRYSVNVEFVERDGNGFQFHLAGSNDSKLRQR